MATKRASKPKRRTTAGVNRTPSNLRNFDKETIDPKARLKLGVEAAGLRQDADNREKRLSATGSAERKRIKELRAEASLKEKEFIDGFRLVPAPTLFSQKTEERRKKQEEAEAKEKSGDGEAATEKAGEVTH